MIHIKVPGSSANLGPGFDVFGLALKSAETSLTPSTSKNINAFLELRVQILSQESSSALNCEITCEGEGADALKQIPNENLITRVALYVLRCHGHHAFPSLTKVRIINGIPLSRGLGSSAAAVVAGVLLGNEVGNLGLSRHRMFDYALMVERHPDNIGAALFGGFVSTFMKTLSPEDTARIEIPLAEVLPELSGGVDTGLPVHEPPQEIGSYHQFSFNIDIKAVVVIPNFKVDTADARSVLPSHYTREDTTFNMQRSSLLPILLGETSPNPLKISEAMRDRIHQPYRAKLIPGFADVLQRVAPSLYDGLLGVCLSGAGPIVLALATHNFEEIARAIADILTSAQDIKCQWQVLELAQEGATVERSD